MRRNQKSLKFLARTFAIYIALGASPMVIAQTDSATLDRIVTKESQRRLGLDKLTAEQRAGVAQLLLDAYKAGQQEGQKAKNAQQSETPRAAPSVIETQIDGDFNGWEGETIVKLMNGQIWQQTEYYYHYHYAFMPNVLIYRTGGGYKMKVDGVEKAVSVQRLR